MPSTHKKSILEKTTVETSRTESRLYKIKSDSSKVCLYFKSEHETHTYTVKLVARKPTTYVAIYRR